MRIIVSGHQHEMIYNTQTVELHSALSDLQVKEEIYRIMVDANAKIEELINARRARTEDNQSQPV